MKIKVEPYNKNWPLHFAELKQELSDLLEYFNPVIEHVGSTSVVGLSAKGIIDILVGINNLDEFPGIVDAMKLHPQYIYYKAFNTKMPTRRLFVKIRSQSAVLQYGNVFKTKEDIPHEALNELRTAHVHVWKLGSEDWIRHIAFRDYLRKHEDVQKEYQALKIELGKINWQHGMEYNKGKNDFIKLHEAKAIKMYKARK